MASRSACRRKTPGTRRMRSHPASVPLGAVRGLGQMGYRHREEGRGGGFEGESEGEGMAWGCVCVCALPLPIRVFNMPSRDPLLRTAHTSLGCQDNGQQASAVTPHFLCTELSNHDRCRQSRRRHYQGPLHFLPAWPSRRPTVREDGAAGAVVYTKKGTGANLRHLWHGRRCLSFFLVLFCFTR